MVKYTGSHRRKEKTVKKSLGIYIHIPFCIKKCFYCDFCSFPNKKTELAERYTDELCRRIKEFSKNASEYCVDTVYFGGGTPTLLDIGGFEKLLSVLRDRFTISADCEISAECNPATADAEYLAKLRSLGVNRLSIGLQSVHDNELSALGRAHSYEDFKKIFFDARASGFDNISVDLMYGIPEQTTESFRESLEAIALLRPEHISAYCLKIESGTVFAKTQSTLRLPDEDEEFEMYLSCTDILSAHGYKKYEISNFSLDGKESRHNLRYWQGLDYIGFGVAAHSLICGERFGNSRDIDSFINGKDIEESRQELNETDIFNEYLMLSLRLTSGLSLHEFKKRFGKEFFEYYPRAKALIEAGYMQLFDNRLSFTDKGFFVSNSILSDMIDAD